MRPRVRKNRRKNSPGFAFPAPLVALLVLIALLALSYLWLCGRCEDLGRRIQELEARNVDLQKRIVNEEYRWTNMTSPRNIEQLLRTHRLNMTWPEESRVIRLPSRALHALEAEPGLGAAQYAQRGTSIRHD
jgi:hypothetical protein